jgi:hypothetical protein
MSTTTVPLRCRWFGHRWFLPSLLNIVRHATGERPVKMCRRCEMQAPLNERRRRPDDGRVVELLVGLVLVVALLGAVLLPVVREVRGVEDDLRSRVCSSTLDATCTEVGP